MPAPLRLFATAFLLSTALTLSGCKSDEEKADEHYQNALTLIQQGDPDRAIVELRNIFRFDGSHKDGRRTLAELMRQRGNLQEAYSQYLRLAEQYPDDLETRIALMQIAFSVNNWDEMERHGSKAAELAPDRPEVKAFEIARAYRDAIRGSDDDARRAAAAKARTLLQDQPEDFMLRSTVIDSDLRDKDLNGALSGIDWLLAHGNTDMRTYQMRLGILAELGDMDAVETQLRELVAKFPDDKNSKAALLRFYLSQKKPDQAEAFLRELAAASALDDPGPTIDLIRFLSETGKSDEARAVIDKAIAERPDPAPFRMIGAGLDFEAGQREEAIATLESVLDGAEPSDQTRNVKVALARMLLATGNEVGARKRVEEVLAEDATNPEALKMQAAWQIQADDTDTAISGLRVVLDHQPEDAQAMTLMAEAYIRSGRPELANDYLAQAVDASKNAPAETLRYVRVLIGDGKLQLAEDLLIKALRLAPSNRDILISLGKLYLQMEDYPRAQHVADTLRRLGDDTSVQAANQIEVERVNRQSGTEDAMTLLEGIAGDAEASLASKIALVQAQIRTGDLDAALQRAKDLKAENPDNRALDVVLATAYAVHGDLDAAEEIYRTLLASDPAVPGVSLQLSNLQMRKGDAAGARQTIEEGLEATPADPRLLWAKASFLERDGDIGGAIKVYEDLYARNSSSLIVANNLASLLASYNDDQDSLDRAWTIARRFRDTDVPAMQDTYGWIAQRRGDSKEALPYLEAAAKALPNDPLVQYHLGKTYMALSQPEAALASFRKAVEIAGPGDQRSQIEEARQAILTLENGASAPAAEN
ncbi:tetratricopeptide repeat protein [Rhodovulum visakhapatnamense]|uniref:Tetratricopeptide repeat protein n=1 Tax=Rhodovulum visakhapatnamense TaxID=364297 RepID=A0A4R8F8Q8_9RHOB|nr:tetratricopeptide repeat protein [Rhodovulum visakhapatnamense]TDX21582.1 tetratricopeptide repeat protein [Rhodovulum visakhapatnamense]